MIEIRVLRKDDNFDDLIALSRQFFGEYKAHHERFFKIDILKDEHITGYFATFCDSSTRKAYVAWENEQAVGYITAYVKDQPDYWQIKKVGEISGLMVSQNYRHQGIAQKLLTKAVEFFTSAGVQYYTVYTAVENRSAIEFYQANGLKPLYTTLIGEVQT